MRNKKQKKEIIEQFMKNLERARKMLPAQIEERKGEDIGYLIMTAIVLSLLLVIIYFIGSMFLNSLPLFVLFLTSSVTCYFLIMLDNLNEETYGTN